MVSVRQSITSDVLLQLRETFKKDPKNILAMNSVSRNDFNNCVVNRNKSTEGIHVFSDKVESESKVTNQKSSGRCWIFAALNVLRNHMIKKYKLEEFEFSQSYLFWCDKFEKSNYFLESIMSTLKESTDSRLIQHLLSNPVQDGGQWDMLTNLIEKYGVMPKSAFPESFHSGNSRMLNWLLTNKLREFACTLRNAHSSGQSIESIQAAKSKMLEEVHRILTIALGEPPLKFDWTFRDKEKNYKSFKNQSPIEFYKNVVDFPLENTVSMINDPRNELNRLFTVEYLGNVVGGRPVTYVNVPIEQLKKYTIKSIKDSRPVWFGCDVSKFLHRPSGLMDMKLFDYELTFGVQLNLNKADRLRYGESAMTHAMTITGVDLISNDQNGNNHEVDLDVADNAASKNENSNADGKPIKWRIENSWGEDTGDKGYLCMTDEWFDEFVYQVVIRKDELDSDILEILQQEPAVLPPWDPMGALA